MKFVIPDPEIPIVGKFSNYNHGNEMSYIGINDYKTNKIVP